MRVSRLFTDQALTVNHSIFLNDKQSHYLIHVLRVKKQQAIILFNGLDAVDYQAQVITTSKRVELLIEKSLPTHNESPVNISIIQALSKNEHIDFMIQKCTELGVNSIIIFNSQRTQMPLKSSKVDKKLAHWERVTQSACEQSGRSIVPNIKFVNQFELALSEPVAKQRLMLDFKGSSINDVLTHKGCHNVDLLLGAEGGLTANEIQLAEQHQFLKVRLGPRVLRTETAAISAVSLIQMLVGDLN